MRGNGYQLKKLNLLVAILCLLIGFPLYSTQISNHVKSQDDLEWGSVLFDYYQNDYFSALIEYDYIVAQDNTMAKSNDGRLLHGGMLLSYGLANDSETLFTTLLDKSIDADVQNKAWYYLANFFYHKSEYQQAFDALKKISGNVPDDFHPDYHYLATLINSKGAHLSISEQVAATLPKNNPHYPYILFNSAINLYETGLVTQAILQLNQVTEFSQVNDEYAALADRAHHGLAQIALKDHQLEKAWLHLTSIRTNGLYSNRALLTYAWTAIKLKRFPDAIGALQILDARSIALPEVQEAKVLLAHLYEQEGDSTKALKSNVLAVKAFKKGLEDVELARQVIQKQDVPREFIENLDVIVSETDWYSMNPSIDYKKLTPFLIDLMSSNIFSEVLKELSDLYALRSNLENWEVQSKQHQIIHKEALEKRVTDDFKRLLVKSKKLNDEYITKKEELDLYSMTLEPSEQKRLKVVLNNSEKELEQLSDKLKQLKGVKQAYQLPDNITLKLTQSIKKLKEKQQKTNQYIKRLEKVVRTLVNAELDKHQDRMEYYWAQTRLAKARLYDATLMKIEKQVKEVDAKAKKKESN